MPNINTNLNIAPYFNDYDSSKNFHQILFKPGTAVQARELTQLQSILQDQVARFGDNILQEGSIVEGGNFVEEPRLPYIKVRDAGWDANDNIISVAVSEYIGMKAKGLTTGLEGFVVSALGGLESQSPNLSTIYVRYTNNAQDTNGNNISVFSATEEIQIQKLNATTGQYENYHRLTAAGSVEANSTGVGYGVRCGDGIIFQKGFFTRFSDAVTIVGRYTPTPTDVVVGFQTNEVIVNSNVDRSLLDNATGYNNENAPGADRLQLVPKLVTKTVTEAENDDSFFTIQEYQDGQVIRKRLTTQFDSVSDVLERRTLEESGNYTVRDFKIDVVRSRSTSSLAITVGTGVGYVNGRRVELLNDYTLNTPQPSEFFQSPQQDVIANYGRYVKVTGLTGDFEPSSYPTIDILDASDVVIGTAKLRTIARENDTTFRMYLAWVKMNNNKTIRNAKKFKKGTAVANLVMESNGRARQYDQKFFSLIFPIGQKAIRSVDASKSDAVYRKTSTATADSNGSFTISLSGGETFPYTPNSNLTIDQKAEFIVVAKAAVGPYSLGEVGIVQTASVDSTGSTVTINLKDAPTATMDVTVLHDVKKTPITINSKTLETTYIKLDLSSHTNGVTGEYSLGIPDVYSLEKVYRHSAYSTDQAHDVTKHFELDRNDFTGTYDLSYIRPKGTITLATTDKLVVQVKAFRKDSSPGSLFTVDSYPIDDTTIPLPADKIRTELIPKFESAKGSVKYLRDCIDMRPWPTATATYTTDLANASINPSNVANYSDIQMPSPNKSIEIEYTFYGSRRDLIVLDEFGKFEVVEGVTAPEPAWPDEPTKGMVVAALDIPPFPALHRRRANQVKKLDYTVQVQPRANKGYTMKDIGSIEQRIDRLEYYTALNALERSAKDMIIPSSDGLDRFKNGIFVDNFENLTIADVRDPEYSAGIDPTYNKIQPKFRTYPVGLKVKSTANVALYKDKWFTLQKDDRSLLRQPYATKSRSCTTDFYRYSGDVTLDPAYDMSPDYTRAPDVSIDIDLQKPFIEFVELLNEFVPLQTENIQTIVNTIRNNETQTFDTTTITSITQEALRVGGRSFRQRVGDFVTNVSFSPFMRSRHIRIHATGMRPNTKFHFFFDGISVDEHMARGAMRPNGKIRHKNKFGTKSITSDANGELMAVFRLPKETFLVGDKYIEISDLSSYNDIANATSYAKVRYSAFNFSVEKTGLSTSTRAPEFDIGTSTSSTSQTNSRPIWNIREGRGDEDNAYSDPIAQTFIISDNQSTDSVVMLSKMNLYFNKKGKGGVRVEIREVVNGYPAPKIVPFSRRRLKNAEINANDKKANTPTVVEFNAPVSLKKGKEYCFVVRPDGNDPDFRLWISKVGGVDVDRNKGVTHDTNAGTLFTSTNNRAWTSYQDENIKFVLFACKFNKGRGEVVFVPNDIEFLDINNISKDFTDNEIVYAEKTVYKAGTVTIAEGSDQITGVGTSFASDYNEGDYIVMKADNNEREVLKIASITNNTAMVVDDYAKRAVTAETEHYPTPAGILTYYTDSEPSVAILEESSARIGLKFSSNDTIVGETSQARANIQTVANMPISWFQANIARVNYGETRTILKGKKFWGGGNLTYAQDVEFGINNHMTKNPTWIRSKSNGDGSNEFELEVRLRNVVGASRDTSPFVDGDISNILVYSHVVNNSVADEDKRVIGKCKSKYISKRVELADGMEAEDMKVFLSVYRPKDTDVDVYVSFQSDTDERDPKRVEWTKLKVKDENFNYSSVNNRQDFREMEFSMRDVAKLQGEGAWRENGNSFKYISSDGSVHNNFKSFTIKICLKANKFNIVPAVKDLRAIALT